MQRDAVGLTLFSDKTEQQFNARSSQVHLKLLFHKLEEVLAAPRLQQKTSAADALHDVAESIHKRSLVIVFSDMFETGNDAENLFKALQHLKHNKHEVLLFHVSDHDTELAFKFDEKPYEFIDLESGDRLKLNPAEIRDRYTVQLKDFHRELQLKCNQLKIDFISANTQTDYYTVLQTYLIKRSKMR